MGVLGFQGEAGRGLVKPPTGRHSCRSAGSNPPAVQLPKPTFQPEFLIPIGALSPLVTTRTHPNRSTVKLGLTVHKSYWPDRRFHPPEVGQDPASAKFVKGRSRAADRGVSSIGIRFRLVILNMSMQYHLIRALRCATVALLPVAHCGRFLLPHLDLPRVALAGSAS
jgi:hypothetical protein